MDLPPLEPRDFATFFEAAQQWDQKHKAWAERGESRLFPPFPWQQRLIENIAAEGRWPDLLDLPTGSGKTAAIDIAVFHLALQAGTAETRQAAMRICFVVDRRLVVEEAFDRAGRLAAALQDAGKTGSQAPLIVQTVARRLQHLAGSDQPPLIARSLRGGAPREDDWARTPCQPTVLCSTVDQVGSRLLFRGYGVSDRMKPVQAGLLGSDALILLDEAHLSQPFRQTAEAIASIPSMRGEDRGRAPFHIALLTATPGEAAADRWRFALSEADLENPVLHRRLKAAKPVTIEQVEAGEEARAEGLARQAKALIEELRLQGIEAPVIGVVANRVARARKAHTLLSGMLDKDATVELVIGPARAVDREDLANRLNDIKTGRLPRPQTTRVVVATQTIEVGVDIDLDGLVTDAASLDSLRQRFGRVNRDGRDIAARGVILAEKADRAPRKEGDAVYGLAVGATLAALYPDNHETVDFGIEALSNRLIGENLVGAAILPLLSEKADAPVLMPAHVDLWSHTAPIPACDPEPALFLHGPRREPTSVQLVWRADVELGVRDDEDAPQRDERLRTLLALTPPRAAEAIELPVWTVRRWLTGEKGLDLADVAQAEPPETPSVGRANLAFRWRGADDDRSKVVTAREIRPGDVIVVPSDRGGCDRYGWAPDVTVAVKDVYDGASEPFAARRYVVRIAPGLILQAVEQELASQAATNETAADDGGSHEDFEWRQARVKARAARVTDQVTVALADAALSSNPHDLAKTLRDVVPEALKGRLARLIDDTGRPRLERRPAFPYGGEPGERQGVVLIAPHGVAVSTYQQLDRNISTEDDGAGSFIGYTQPLAEHSGEVECKAREFADRAGLPKRLVADLALAGWLHDAGKADPRFQRLLYDGDLVAMEQKGPLAKSGLGRSAPGAWERARLPARWRHEALSVRLALENPRLGEAHDRALVLWLVGTHHGHGRPFFPHQDVLDASERDLATVQGLTPPRLGVGIGPQSLGFVIEGDFGPTECDEQDLRGLDWVTLFRDLKRRYGAWGLARLEAILRLADHRASEAAAGRRDALDRP